MLTAQETGHGGGAGAGCGQERRTSDLGLVSQPVFQDLGFVCWLTHNPDFTSSLARILLAPPEVKLSDTLGSMGLTFESNREALP